MLRRAVVVLAFSLRLSWFAVFPSSRACMQPRRGIAGFGQKSVLGASNQRSGALAELWTLRLLSPALDGGATAQLRFIILISTTTPL